MFISPELFLDCLLLIINDSSDRSRSTVLELIRIFETESKVNTTIDNDVTRFYIRIIKTIIERNITKVHSDELRMILLKFKSDPVLASRKDVFDILHETFGSSTQLEDDRLQKLATRIQNTLLWHRVNSKNRMMYSALSRAADSVDTINQEAELQKVLGYADEISTVFQHSDVATQDPLEFVDFSNKSSIKAALHKHKARAVSGIIKTGLQGLNRMCGTRGGVARGESIVFYALPHHYKSGMLVSMCKWGVAYNLPDSQETKKPIIVLFSLENEAFQNTVWLFRQIYETSTKQSSRSMTDDDICEYIFTYFNDKGYLFVIERHQPSDFGFKEYVSRIQYYEKAGYNVYLSVVDYLNLAKKGNGERSTSTGAHMLVRELYSSFCNYTKAKGITFMTAHPLNRKAGEIAASGITNVVKRFSIEHIADSVDVSREVDLEVYMYIERNHAGEAFLTCRRGKHRYVDDTPISHQFFAYKFSKFGIEDDVLSEPRFVTDIFADESNPDNDAVSVDTSVF